MTKEQFPSLAKLNLHLIINKISPALVCGIIFIGCETESAKQSENDWLSYLSACCTQWKGQLFADTPFNRTFCSCSPIGVLTHTCTHTPCLPLSVGLLFLMALVPTLQSNHSVHVAPGVSLSTDTMNVTHQTGPTSNKRCHVWPVWAPIIVTGKPKLAKHLPLALLKASFCHCNISSEEIDSI